MLRRYRCISVSVLAIAFFALAFISFISLAAKGDYPTPAQAILSDEDGGRDTKGASPDAPEPADIPILLKPVEYAGDAGLEADGEHALALAGSSVFVKPDKGVLAALRDGRAFRVWLGGDIGYLAANSVSATTDITGNTSCVLATQGGGSGCITATASSRVFGSLWREGRVFEIAPMPTSDAHQVVELLDDAWDRAAYTEIPVRRRQAATAPSGDERADADVASKKHEPRTIDILTLYSPDLAKRIGKRSGGKLDVGAVVSGIISSANGALARSGVSARLRLVGIQEVRLSEKDYPVAEALLRNLQQGKKEFKRIAELRAAAGADLVVLFISDKAVAPSDSVPVSLAAAFRPMSAGDLRPENGFAVVACRNSNHEAGLSFSRAFASLLGVAGSYHTHNSAEKRPFARAAWGYHVGPEEDYPFGRAGRYGTIMTSAKAVLPYYSNPDIIVLGEPIGKWAQQEDDAFAARAMDEAAPLVADYAPEVGNDPPVALSMERAEGKTLAFTFRDLQGANEIIGAQMEFRAPSKGKSFSLSLDTLTRRHTLHAELLSDAHASSRHRDGDDLCSVDRRQTRLRKSGADLTARLALDLAYPEVRYNVYARAFDVRGTSAGWTCLGPLPSLSIQRDASPATDPPTIILNPKLQKLINAGKEFYVGVDLYQGLYKYWWDSRDKKNTEIPLSDWIDRIRQGHMNYIRLILQSNVWFKEADIYWWYQNGHIHEDRSFFNYSAGKFAFEFSDNPQYNEFMAGIAKATNDPFVMLHVDVFDDCLFKNDYFLDSEYYIANNNKGLPVAGETYSEAKCESGFTLAILNKYDGTTEYNGYLISNIPDQFKNGYCTLLSKVKTTLENSGNNKHILGDGNEIDEISGKEFKLSRAILHLANYSGPMAVGNQTLAKNPSGADTSFLADKYLAVHNVMQAGSEDYFIDVYNNLKQHYLDTTGHTRRVLFSTDGVKPRPSKSKIARLYYYLITGKKGLNYNADSGIDILDVGGLADIRCPGSWKGEDIGTIKMYDAYDMAMYWRFYVNKPPYIIPAGSTAGEPEIEVHPSTNNKCTYVFTVNDLDGNGIEADAGVSGVDGTYNRKGMLEYVEFILGHKSLGSKDRGGFETNTNITGLKINIDNNNGTPRVALRDSNGNYPTYMTFAQANNNKPSNQRIILESIRADYSSATPSDIKFEFEIKREPSWRKKFLKNIYVRLADKEKQSFGMLDGEPDELEPAFGEALKQYKFETDYMYFRKKELRGAPGDDPDGFHMPWPISLAPASPKGDVLDFYCTYEDPDGWADINEMYLILTDEANPTARNVRVKYVKQGNKVYLSNESGTEYIASGDAGGTGTLSNSLIEIALIQTKIDYSSGNTLRMKFAVTAKGAFLGASLKEVCMAVTDLAGHASDEEYMDDWDTDMAPVPISVTPSEVSSTGKTLTVEYYNPKGVANFNCCKLSIKQSLSSANAAYISYNENVNKLCLLADDGSTWLTKVLGTAGAYLENNQCKVDVGNSSKQTVGTNTLVLTIPISFKQGYYGIKNMYMRCSSDTGLDSGWQDKGDFTITWGSIKGTIDPPEVRTNPNARWSLDGGAFDKVHDQTEVVDGSIPHVVRFKEISGRPPTYPLNIGSIEPGEVKEAHWDYSPYGTLKVDFMISTQTDTSSLTQAAIDAMNAEVSASGQFKVYNANTGDAVNVIKNGISMAVGTGENNPNGYQLPPGKYNIEVINYSPTRFANGREEKIVYDVYIRGGAQTSVNLYYLPVGSITVFLGNALWRDDGAQWRQVRPGLPASEWRASGYKDEYEPIGDYYIELKALPSWHAQSFTVIKQVVHGTNTGYSISPADSGGGTLTGQMTVYYNPQRANDGPWFNAKWSAVGVSDGDHQHGQTISLNAGYRTIEYFLDGGYQLPAPVVVPVRPLLPHSRTQGFVVAVGAIEGYVFPNGARNAGGAWKILDGSNIWRLHHEVAYNVNGPDETIRYKTITGWTAPADIEMPLIHGQTTHTVDYGSGDYTQSSPPGAGGVVSVPLFAKEGTGEIFTPALKAAESDEKPENLCSGYFIKMSTVGNLRVDFNGDGKADIAAYDPATGDWLVHGKGVIYTLGGPDAWPVPGDYDGDKKTEPAVFRFETGLWEVKGVGAFTLGAAGDYPVPGDYDGDGVTDPAVFSPGTGLVEVRYMRNKAIGGEGRAFANAAGSFPYSADFNGDGLDEIVGYDRGRGEWAKSGAALLAGGGEDDISVVADFDGDGKADVAFFKPKKKGIWVIVGQGGAVRFGQDGDVPIPSDYDGDGKADIAVYRPSTSEVLILGRDEKYAFDRRGLIPLAGGR